MAMTWDGRSPLSNGSSCGLRSRRRAERRRAGEQGGCRGLMIERVPDRVATGGQHELSAEPADRVEHQGPLEVDREAAPLAAVEDHVDERRALVVQLQRRPVARTKLDTVVTDRQ